MLLPIDTIAVALYLFLIAALPGTDGLLIPAAMTPGASAPLAAVMLLSALLAAAAASWLTTHLVIRQARASGPLRRRDLGGIAGIGMRVFAVVMTVLTLECSKWPFVVSAALGLRGNFTAVYLLGLLPYALVCFAVWIPQYPLHRLITPGRWTLVQFLLHKVRYSFFILGVVVPVVLLQAVLRGTLAGGWEMLIVYAFLLLMLWTFPLFLRFFWGCRSLAEGPMRARIRALERQAGVGFSGVYVWDLGGAAMVNAAAVGLVPPFRYLFLSRGLLEQLPDDEIEGVVCHELGHVRHKHLLFYLALTAAVMTTIQSLLVAGSMLTAWLGTVAALVLYIRFGFAWFSRRFERQADLYALEVTGDPAPLCRALEHIGRLYGGIRHVKNWHHQSIAERVSFLQAAAADPARAARHHAHLRRAVRLGYAFALFVLVTSVGAQLLQPPPLLFEETATDRLAHWRRVRELVPDEPDAPLQLARIWLDRAPAPEALAMAEQYTEEAAVRAQTAPQRREVAALRKRIARERRRRDSAD